MHKCIYIGVNVSICVYVYICKYVYMYICIDVYIYFCGFECFAPRYNLQPAASAFFHGLLMTTVLESPLPSGNLFKQWMSFAILASANASWCLTR